MAYVIGLVVVGLFFLALHYFTEVNTRQKIIISVVTLAIVLSAIAFNKYSSSQRDNMMHAVLKFNQNKNVNCEGVDINNTNYTLSVGTYTFIGKKNTPNYGQMISVSTCE